MCTGNPARIRLICCYILASVVAKHLADGEISSQCGGTLTAVRGILQTPGFPNEFRVPILCKWVIDATEIASANTSIVVYLTQLFVFEGLTFEEYETYDRRYNILGKTIHIVIESNVSKVRWVRTTQNVMVVTFQLHSIENTHLRVLDHFLDVYGFNITYEITTQPVRSDSCTMSDCGFTGICYDDYQKFYCKCFRGYSGPSCANGPNSLCARGGSNYCKNGGICKQLGTTLARCDCSDDYGGEQCQNRINFSSKQECHEEALKNSCHNCSKDLGIQLDGTELSTTLRLMQGPTLKNELLHLLIQSQIYGSKIGLSPDQIKIAHLHYYDWGTEATIYFYASKKDKRKIESLINKWVQAGHIGNLTLIDKNIFLRNDSRLFIKNLSINQMGVIREGDQFILSCVVQGTPTVSVRWLKDSISINVTQHLSNKWFRFIPDPGIKNQYTAILGVDKASYLDEGTFVCEAKDYQSRHCLSRFVQIRRPPNVKIEPMSLTVQKGENFTVKCVCLSHNKQHKLTYSWTKNKELLPIKTDMEKYEILYPGGSILQVYKIDKPTVYSCLVQDEVAATEVNIQVDVIDRFVVHTCRGEKHMSILWPETAPGTQSIQECPKSFTGTVRRWCVLQDFEKSIWQLPDFSMCTSDYLKKTNNDFQQLRLGYDQTNELELLENYNTYVKNAKTLLPGEGAQILSLVSDIVSYINNSRRTSMIYNATNIIFKITNDILQHESSLINQAQIILLQEIVKNHVAFFNELINESLVYHKAFSNVDITIVGSGKSNNFSTIPIRSEKYPKWYSYKFEISASNEQEIKDLDKNLILACVAYKDLSTFLPTRSAIRAKDGSEMEYEIISKIVAVWILNKEEIINADGIYHFDIEFSHSVINTSMSKWSINCSVATYATYGYSWDISECYTYPINSTATKCSCRKAGTYAILITAVPPTVIVLEQHSFQTLIIIGCSGCLMFSLISEIILIIHWILQRSSLTFLKVQYCFVLSCAMVIFIIALSEELSEDSYPYINTCLEILLLIAMASHLSKCLIVFTEFVRINSKAPHLSKTVVAISTGVPIITVFASHLTHRTMGRKQSSWWLINGSVSFNIFITAFLMLIFLYNIMYLMVMDKIGQSTDKQHKYSAIAQERKKFLRRSFGIFWITTMMICSSIMYINLKESQIWSYAFTLSNFLQGLVVFTCYILKPENPVISDIVEKIRLKATDKTGGAVNIAKTPSNSSGDYEKSITVSRTSFDESAGHSKPTALILSDLQNIPTYNKSHPLDNFYNNESTSSHGCGTFKEVKECKGTPFKLTKQKHQEYHKTDVQEYLYSPDVVSTRVHVELDLVTPILHDACDHAKNISEDQPIILCNIAVNSRCEVNQKQLSSYPNVTEEKMYKDTIEETLQTQLKSEPCQPKVVVTPPIEETTTGSIEIKVLESPKSVPAVIQQSPDSLDGMLNKISHDLDYLLNR